MQLDLTPISPNTIFEANATLITGILILLTISSLSEKNNENMKSRRQALTLIVISVIFFVLSIGFLLGLNNPEIAENAYTDSIIALVAGLIYLIMTMFNIIRVISKV